MPTRNPSPPPRIRHARPSIQRLSAREIKARHEAIIEHFERRQRRLQIVATTRTAHGQVLDWVPVESQIPGGVIAAPLPIGRDASSAARAARSSRRRSSRSATRSSGRRARCRSRDPSARLAGGQPVAVSLEARPRRDHGAALEWSQHRAARGRTLAPLVRRERATRHLLWRRSVAERQPDLGRMVE